MLRQMLQQRMEQQQQQNAEQQQRAPEAAPPQPEGTALVQDPPGGPEQAEAPAPTN